MRLKYKIMFIWLLQRFFSPHLRKVHSKRIYCISSEKDIYVFIEVNSPFHHNFQVLKREMSNFLVLDYSAASFSISRLYRMEL